MRAQLGSSVAFGSGCGQALPGGAAQSASMLIPSLACARTREARREAASTCVGQRRSLSATLNDSALLAGHDDNAASSAPSLSSLHHGGISSRRRSDRHLSSASSAVFMHPYGALNITRSAHSLRHDSRARPAQEHGRQRREAVGICVGQRWCQLSLEEVAPRSGTRLPRECKNAKHHTCFDRSSSGPAAETLYVGTEIDADTVHAAETPVTKTAAGGRHVRTPRPSNWVTITRGQRKYWKQHGGSPR